MFRVDLSLSLLSLATIFKDTLTVAESGLKNCSTQSSQGSNFIECMSTDQVPDCFQLKYFN
jgi:hypothetical protein